MLTALAIIAFFFSLSVAHSQDAHYCTLGNDTEITPCQVPYKSSTGNYNMLVLSCPGARDNTNVTWIHTLRNQNYSICSESQDGTCVVKGYGGRLSNDDSGLYYCVLTNTSIHGAMVTIQAPPQITNVFNFPNVCTPKVARYSCTTSDLGYMFGDRFNLSVTYKSVGEAAVHWYHNDTELLCPTSNNEPIRDNCISTYNVPGRSEITIFAQHEDFNPSGHYRGVVTNSYGSNETVTNVTFQCREPSDIIALSPKDVYYNFTVGDVVDLDSVCKLVSPHTIDQTICYSPQTNATFQDVVTNESNCARCSYGDQWSPSRRCSIQWENTDSYYVMVASTTVCKGVTTIQLASRRVSLADGGKIFCSYSNNDATVYTTVHINIMEKPPLNWILLEVLIPMGLVLMVLTAVLAVLGYKYHLRKRAASMRKLTRLRREKSLLEQERGNKTKRNGITVSSRPPRSRPRNYGTIPDSTDHGDTLTDAGGLTTDQPEWTGDDLPTTGGAIV